MEIMEKHGRFYVSDGDTSHGWFATRELAEAFVKDGAKGLQKVLDRSDRFTWKDGDVEHHE